MGPGAKSGFLGAVAKWSTNTPDAAFQFLSKTLYSHPLEAGFPGKPGGKDM